jgi:uncharacterized membrane protein YGL010W
MKSVNQWFDEYAESHKNPINKTIHWICVPVIMFSLLGMLWNVRVSSLFQHPLANLSVLIMVLASLFYLRLSSNLALGMYFISLFMGLTLVYMETLNLPILPISIVLFVVAWIGQFIGHKIEGKKPSFFKDLQFLLIGPIWLMGFVYKKLEIKY